MVRVTALTSPLLLGFDDLERALDKVSKTGGDGYPPYNIERIAAEDGEPERLRITLAVAGFSQDQIEVTVEESQLAIRGRQQEDKTREYLHRGIAARQFQRSFLLADGMQVLSADLRRGCCRSTSFGRSRSAWCEKYRYWRATEACAPISRVDRTAGQGAKRWEPQSTGAWPGPRT
jgi:HSP20 family molecular chaperone IbpA